MIIKYKLTSKDGRTYECFQWPLPQNNKPGEWLETDGAGEPCTKHWLHFYHHPYLAILLNPIHADIKGG